MSKANLFGSMTLCGVVLFAAGTSCFAQAPSDNPYRPVRGLADGGGPSTPGGEWAKLPGGREMGPPAAVHVDVDGESVWAFIRCDETSPVPAARNSQPTRFDGRREATTKPTTGTAIFVTSERMSLKFQSLKLAGTRCRSR